MAALRPGFSPAGLWAALQAFPPLATLTTQPEDVAFALLGSSVNAHLSGADRAALEASLGELGRGFPSPPIKELRGGMVALLRLLQKNLSDPEFSAYRDPADALLELVKGLPDALPRPVPGEDRACSEDLAKRLKVTVEGLQRFEKLPAAMEKPAFQAAVNALFRQHSCFYSLASGDPAPPVGFAARALGQALWATVEA